jgi:hypothetical protein
MKAAVQKQMPDNPTQAVSLICITTTPWFKITMKMIEKDQPKTIMEKQL